MRRSMLILISFSFLLAHLVVAQTHDGEPKIVATITFADGSTVGLVEFAIFGAPKSPLTYLRVGDQERPVPGIPIRGDRFWMLQPIEALKSATFTNTESTLQLKDGSIIRGYVPKNPTRETWLSGYAFKFKGKRSVLGQVGEFTMARGNVAAISQKLDEPGQYEITDTKGTVTSVADLELVRATHQDGPERPRSDLPKSRIKFRVDETSVDLLLGDIASLTFPDKSVLPLGITMKNGEQAAGYFDDASDCEFVFGKTAAGQLLFTPLTRISSRLQIRVIEFK